MSLTETDFRSELGDSASKAFALVLAAGSSTRFGGDKLVAPFRGRPLIAHVTAVVAEAIAAGIIGGGVAVVRPTDTRLGWHFDTAGLDLVPNPDADSGLASSIRRGLEALSSAPWAPAASAAVIILADQPLVQCGVIQTLVSQWRRTGLTVRPRYAEQPLEPGHPVVLDRGFWPQARELEGDRGLGAMLRARPEAVTIVDVPGSNPDVDSVEDLLKLGGGD